MSTFHFSTLHKKIPFDKLLYVLNKITDFAFKGRTRDYVTVYNSGAFWSWSKSEAGRSCSLQETKSCLEFLINNSFFHVGSKIFCQAIGIPMGSDPAPFFANLFCRFFENHCNGIYQPKLILKKENTSNTETTFLDLRLYINEGQIQTSNIYDKRTSYNFSIVRFTYKSSTIPSKMFFATVSAEILWICWATSSVVQFIKHLRFSYIECWGKGQIL